MLVQCPNCDWNKEAPQDVDGKNARCPKCGATFLIGTTPKKQTRGEVPGSSEQQDKNAEDTKLNGADPNAEHPQPAVAEPDLQKPFSPFFADETLSILAWFNLVFCIIGGVVWMVRYENITLGLVCIWGGILHTALLLTIAQIARTQRRRIKNMETITGWDKVFFEAGKKCAKITSSRSKVSGAK